MKQQSLKRCPIGIQTFEEIINKDYLYIDKTEYVYRMAYGASKYYFLSRPRRFGRRSRLKKKWRKSTRRHRKPLSAKTESP